MPSDGPTELVGSERPKRGIIVHVLSDGRLLTRQRLMEAVCRALGKAGLDPSKYCGPNRGCNGSSRKRYGRFCHQNPGKVVKPSVSGVYPHLERTIGTLFKIVVFMISNCGCLNSAIGAFKGFNFNYYREKSTIRMCLE